MPPIYIPRPDPPRKFLSPKAPLSSNDAVRLLIFSAAGLAAAVSSAPPSSPTPTPLGMPAPLSSPVSVPAASLFSGHSAVALQPPPLRRCPTAVPLSPSLSPPTPTSPSPPSPPLRTIEVEETSPTLEVEETSPALEVEEGPDVWGPHISDSD